MISLYLSGDTWLHKLPAGLKLAGLAAATVVVLPLGDPLPLAVLLAATVALYAGVGAAALRRLALVRPLWPLLAALIAFQAAMGEVATGITVSLRIVLMVWLANLVTMTTRMDDMIDSVAFVLRPLRRLGVDDRMIALGVALVIRFTPYLFAEWRQLADAWRARAGRGGGWRLLAPFCVHVIGTGEHVGEALAARLGRPPR